MRQAIPHFMILLAACGVLAGTSCAPQRNASGLIGVPAPKLSFESYEKPGTFENLDSFSGKVVVISFWRTTSDPSREAMPFLDNLYSTYRAKGLEVIAVTSEDRPTIDTFRLDTHYEYPIYLDKGGKFLEAMRIYAIPAIVVVGRNGVIQMEAHPLEKSLLLEAIQSSLGE